MILPLRGFYAFPMIFIPSLGRKRRHRVSYCGSKKKSPDSNNRALLLNEASIFYLAMVIFAAVLKFLP
jgi:hypothetical protein